MQKQSGGFIFGFVSVVLMDAAATMPAGAPASPILVCTGCIRHASAASLGQGIES